MSIELSTNDRDLTISSTDRGGRPRGTSTFALLAMLRQWFSADFHLVDGETGELERSPPEQRGIDFTLLGPLCRAIAQRGRVELVDEQEPLLTLAIPIEDATGQRRAAVGVFVAAGAITAAQLRHAATRLAVEPEQAAAWIARQPRWTPNALLAMGVLTQERLAADRRLAMMEAEVRDVSTQLSSTYEEISLLHRLTQNLKLTSNDDELGRLALEWLADVVPAESLAILLTPLAHTSAMSGEARDEPLLLAHGRCPVDSDGLTRMVEHFALKPGQQPLLVNPPTTLADDWPWPDVRQMMLVSLSEGANCFGWLAAFNHCDGCEFGSVEASLLGSVGVILGIHSGNAELYRQQREFFAGVVRALTSAIDAKDPYTCGHSDRVARVSVRLAEELGCDRNQVETIYLSGLLHDVGKIGIDDTVLRKPGKLTDTEFEHIKTHTEIGYKILVDIKKLDEVLPVVLHHHEQWDGRGYPRGLAGEKIPFLARIVAVADAFDAMGSDRPYRQGMSDEKLDAILRDGAGRQWDAHVVDAFFRARDDVRQISRQPVARVTLELRK
jgi:putative nucleotidyltransferase with HDIG domain